MTQMSPSHIQPFSSLFLLRVKQSCVVTFLGGFRLTSGLLGPGSLLACWSVHASCWIYVSVANWQQSNFYSRDSQACPVWVKNSMPRYGRKTNAKSNEQTLRFSVVMGMKYKRTKRVANKSENQNRKRVNGR